MQKRWETETKPASKVFKDLNITNMIKVFKFFLVVLAGAFPLFACSINSPIIEASTQDSTLASSINSDGYPTAPPITPIPAAPEPAWVTILYPKPGQTILLSDYIAEKHKTHSGSLPAPDVSSSVCVEVWAGNLIEEGDDWEAEDVIERTNITVDGVLRSHTSGWYDGIVLYTVQDAEGNELGRVGGPYAFCVSAPLGVGLHQADINFEKNSGTTETFTWTFEIVDHAIPHPTSLPTPSEIDRNGELPRFIRAVYPQPGQIASIDHYFQISENDIEIDEIWASFLSEDPGEQKSLSDSNNKQKVCFAFRVPELLKIGAFPENTRDWPDRIYILVDGRIQEEWLYPSLHFYDASSDSVSVHCVTLELKIGEHITTIYVQPFDGNLVTYSWLFTIEE